MAQTKIAQRKRAAPPAPRRPKLRWGVLGLAVLVAGSALAWHPWSRGGDDIIYTTSTAQVTYEVDGSGNSPSIEYVTGPDNQTDTAMHAQLPWRKTLSLPVGLAGAVADMTARYPTNGQPLSCKLTVNGKVVRETTSSDGFSDAACSYVIPATHKN